MGVETTPALVLAVQDWSSTSQIVRLLTEVHGNISVLARGSRRMSADFRFGPLDVLQWGEAAVVRQKRGFQLAGFAARTAFPQLARSATRLALALELAEVLHEGTPAAPQPGVLQLALESLAALESAPEETVQEVALRFQLRWLVLSGRQPVLDRCVLCDRSAPGRSPVRIDPWRGGVVCRACLRHPAPRITTLSVAAQGALRELIEAPAGTVRIPAAAEPVIARLLDLMVAFALDRPPRHPALDSVRA